MNLKKLKTELNGYAYLPKYLDELVGRALRFRMKVTIFECRDEEGGFGIKIDGKEVVRNMAWECLECDLEKKNETN